MLHCPKMRIIVYMYIKAVEHGVVLGARYRDEFFEAVSNVKSKNLLCFSAIYCKIQHRETEISKALGAASLKPGLGDFTSRQEVCGITAYAQLAAVLCVGECILCTEYDKVSNILINFIFGFSSLVRIKQRVGHAPTITAIISLCGSFHCFLWQSNPQ